MLLATLVLTALAGLLFWWLLKRLPSSPLGRHLILEDAETTAAGFMTQAVRQELLGKTGTVVTPLRLAGTVRLEDELLDVECLSHSSTPRSLVLTLTFSLCWALDCSLLRESFCLRDCFSFCLTVLAENSLNA